MLSSTADYALRAILVLARHADRRVLPADEIADATGSPRNYMAKTLNALAKAGVVTSTRGALGGFSLAHDPSALSVASIVDLFDEPRPHERCLLGTRPCNPEAPCEAHHRWLEITNARRAPLASTTIAELIAG